MNREQSHIIRQNASCLPHSSLRPSHLHAIKCSAKTNITRNRHEKRQNALIKKRGNEKKRKRSVHLSNKQKDDPTTPRTLPLNPDSNPLPKAHPITTSALSQRQKIRSVLRNGRQCHILHTQRSTPTRARSAPKSVFFVHSPARCPRTRRDQIRCPCLIPVTGWPNAPAPPFSDSPTRSLF